MLRPHALERASRGGWTRRRCSRWFCCLRRRSSLIMRNAGSARYAESRMQTAAAVDPLARDAVRERASERVLQQVSGG